MVTDDDPLTSAQLLAVRGRYAPPRHVVKLVDELTKLRVEAARRGPCAACPFAGCDCQWQGGK